MFSSLTIAPATPEQVIISSKRAYVGFGKGLSEDEYTEREVNGQTIESGKDGKLMTWILVPRDNPTTLDFFSSCKTFKREVAVCYTGRTETVSAIGYGIASVFTAPEHRGKGYAKHMMRLLHWVLASEEYLPKAFPAEWGDPPARCPSTGDGLFSALWSDVGLRLYRECGPVPGDEGWVVISPWSTIWTITETGVLDSHSLEKLLKNLKVTWLDENLAEELWRKDAEKLSLTLTEGPSQSTRFCFLPTGGVGLYQWFRSHYLFSRHIHNPPTFCGVQLENENANPHEAISTYATWTFEYRPGYNRSLIVTCLNADESTIGLLISLMLNYAHMHRLDQVEAWNLPGCLGETSGFNCKRVERALHLPSLRWYGIEPMECLDWKYNERYASIIPALEILKSVQVLLVLGMTERHF